MTSARVTSSERLWVVIEKLCGFLSGAKWATEGSLCQVLVESLCRVLRN